MKVFQRKMFHNSFYVYVQKLSNREVQKNIYFLISYLIKCQTLFLIDSFFTFMCDGPWSIIINSSV